LGPAAPELRGLTINDDGPLPVTGDCLEDIVAGLVRYVLAQHPSHFTTATLPRDQSLFDLGVLDSAGVIEFIIFVETTWEVEISDEDITKERMGSLDKMATLVHEYVARKE
jgi:acyl carrier protein